MFMSFLGCVGKLMGGSGITILMIKAFVGVEELLIGGRDSL